MKKRILCLVLSMTILVTVLQLSVMASGDTTPSLRTSPQTLEMIKGFEGFSRHAYKDGKQWTIGYGTACEPGTYPNGITEQEAQVQLQEHLVTFETAVNRYAQTYQISLKQHEFDALVSMTYNLGVGWINSSYRFWSMLRNGLGNYSHNEIASAMGVWCHVGSQISQGLLSRRMAEIKLFLYGDYTGNQSPNFKSLIFRGNGGTVDTDVMLYLEQKTYIQFPNAQREGYHFAGWYTAAEGGTKITADQPAVTNQTVYARWSKTPVEQTALPSSGYRDVADSVWYAPYVMELSDAGILNGYEDGTFKPDEKVTAGQALKLILLAAGYPEQRAANGHWAGGYYQTAWDAGLIHGQPMTNLDVPVSRGVVAMLAANALDLPLDEDAAVFTDTDDPYSATLYRAGMVSGSTDGSGNRVFAPEQDISRAELAKIVYEMMKV